MDDDHVTQLSTHSLFPLVRSSCLQKSYGYMLSACRGILYIPIICSSRSDRKQKWPPLKHLVCKPHKPLWRQWRSGRGDPISFNKLDSLGVGHDWATSLSLFIFMHWRRKWQPTPVFLPGESQGQGSLVGCRLWGGTKLDTTEAT